MTRSAMDVGRLLLAGASPADFPGHDPAALARVARMAALVRHDAPASVAQVAAQFDRAAAIAPLASVAVCSLDDADRLAAATAEIVGWLKGQGLLGGDVLDLGCGLGRIAVAVAPLCRSVLGVDVSRVLLGQAWAHPKVSYRLTEGAGLGWLDEDRFDLVLAMDSMPYLVQAEVADRHVADIARLLRPGGALVVLNLCYDGPADALAAIWAARHSWRLELAGARPFACWDGAAFVFRG